jgi:hypothetical protein
MSGASTLATLCKLLAKPLTRGTAASMVRPMVWPTASAWRQGLGAHALLKAALGDLALEKPLRQQHTAQQSSTAKREVSLITLSG